jgi:hypothetical protein
VTPRSLTRDEACDALSQLAEIDGGLNHAYVKMTAAGLALTDVSVAKEFEHVRYAVRSPPALRSDASGFFRIGFAASLPLPAATLCRTFLKIIWLLSTLSRT